MRKKTPFFSVHGSELLAPDAGVGFDYNDLDSADSGRDEAGFMHRCVLRYKVCTWSFEYEKLTEQEKEYMERLFQPEPDGTIEFTHPDPLDSSILVTTKCYRSRYGISWHNAKTGEWRNYKFNIIEC